MKTPSELGRELIEASKEGNVDRVDKLLRERAYCDYRDEKGTALHYACYYKVVEKLLEKNSDVNSKNILGNAPIHIAADKGMPELVRLLLQNEADPNLLDKYEFLALEIAVINCEQLSDRELISDDEFKRGGSGNSPSSLDNRKEVVKLFTAYQGLGYDEVVSMIVAKNDGYDGSDYGMLDTELLYVLEGAKEGEVCIQQALEIKERLKAALFLEENKENRDVEQVVEEFFVGKKDIDPLAIELVKKMIKEEKSPDSLVKQPKANKARTHPQTRNIM